MNKIRVLTIFIGFLSVVAIISCSGSKSNFSDLIEEYIPHDELKKIQYVVIIPNNGCGGCITKAEEFYASNQSEIIYYFFYKYRFFKDAKK